MSKAFWSIAGAASAAVSAVLWLRRQYLGIDHPASTHGHGLTTHCPVPECGELIWYPHPANRMSAVRLHVEYHCMYAEEVA